MLYYNYLGNKKNMRLNFEIFPKYLISFGNISEICDFM